MIFKGLAPMVEIKRWALIIAALTFTAGVGVGIGVFFAPGEDRQRAATEILRAGFIDEFITRKDGYPGLMERYGLKFPHPPVSLAPGEVYRQLINRKVDVISGPKTSAGIRSNTLVALKADKNSFLPRYEAAPLIRRTVLSDHPELKKLLESLAQKISEKQMREMNHQVEKDGESAEKVARKFLASQKLLNQGQSSRGGPGGTITIGSKSFTESEILAELMAILIEGKSNIKVRRKFNLGTTATVFNRIRGGEIDLYAEYTGTGMSILGSLNPRELQDPDVAFAMVRQGFARRYDLVWLERFGFNNSWTLFMRRNDARDLGLKTISDLAGLLKEQSELEIPSLPAQVHFTMGQVKTATAPEQVLRDLKERLQPPLEGGRMGKTREERLRAQIDLVSLHIKLGNELKNFNDRLFKIVEVAKKTGKDELTNGRAKSLLSKIVEDKKVASRARNIAEPFRVKIGETARALIEQIQYLEKNAGTILPQDTFQWKTDFNELLKRVEVLAVSSWDTALKESHKQVELLEKLEKFGANPGHLKSLRDAGVYMRKEIVNLKHYFTIAGMQREQLQRQISLATDQEEVTEACLKLRAEQVALVESGTFEDFRLVAKTHCEEKRAVVLGQGVELIEALLVRKRGKKNDLEWDLDFEHRQLEELKKVKGADKKITAASKKVEGLQSALDSTQKDLAALDGLVKKVQLKMRLARLQAEPLQKVAFVETGLGVEKPGAHSRIPSTWKLGSILALMALGTIVGVRYRVWGKKWLWTSRGAKNPPEDEEEGNSKNRKRVESFQDDMEQEGPQKKRDRRS